MSNLFWLTDAQMARLEPFLPKSHGKPRVDDTSRAERNYLPQSQRLAVVRCPQGVRPAEDSLQPMEAVGRQGHLCPDDGRPGLRGRRSEDGDD
jgi:hypothetical protein